MDQRIDAHKLLALQSRQLVVVERALEALTRHLGSDTLADELLVMAEQHGDDLAGSLLWRLARLARRPR